jgi:hypothetical protein
MNKLVILIIILVLLIICFIVFKINEKSTYRAETNPTDTQLLTFYTTLINSVSSNYTTYDTNQRLSGITTLSTGSSLKSNSKCNYLRTNDGTYRLYLDKPTGPIFQFGINMYYADLNIRNYAYTSAISIKTLNKASSSITYSELSLTNSNVTFKDNTGTATFNFFNYPQQLSSTIELKLYNGLNVGITTPVLYIQAATLTTSWNNRFGTTNLILWEPTDNRSLLVSVSGSYDVTNFNENSQLFSGNTLYKYNTKLDYVTINSNTIKYNSTVLYEASSLRNYTGQYNNYVLRITNKGEVQFFSTGFYSIIDTLRSTLISSGKAPYFLEINNDNVLQIRDLLGNKGILDDIPRSSLKNGQSLWADGNRLYSTNREFSFHLERGIIDPINIYMIVTKDPIASYSKIIWKSKAIPTTTTSNRVRIKVQQNNWGGLLLEELDSSNNQISFKWITGTKEETDRLEIDTSGYLRIYNSSGRVVWPTETIPKAKGMNIKINYTMLSNTRNELDTAVFTFKYSGTWGSGQNIGVLGYTTSIELKPSEHILYGVNHNKIIDYNNKSSASYNDIKIIDTYGNSVAYSIYDSGIERYAVISNGNEDTPMIESSTYPNSPEYAPFRYNIDITKVEILPRIIGWYKSMYYSDVLSDITTILEVPLIIYSHHINGTWHGLDNRDHNNAQNNINRIRIYAFQSDDSLTPDTDNFNNLVNIKKNYYDVYPDVETWDIVYGALGGYTPGGLPTGTFSKAPLEIGKYPLPVNYGNNAYAPDSYTYLNNFIVPSFDDVTDFSGSIKGWIKNNIHFTNKQS